MDLPVFEMVINPEPTSDIEVSFVALVDKPAIERNFLAFKSNEFKVGDKVKVVPGKEHDPSHAGMIMKIAEIKGTAIALKMPDGTIHKWYTKEELMPASSFSQDFVTPNKGETKDDFLKRCIPVLITEGKDQDQAVAVCNSMYEQKSFSFQIINEDQRIISGPAMVANSLIYRQDENGEYNVFFSKETIKDISIKFFKKGYEKNVNLFHDPNMKMDGVTIFESFVTDVQRGIQPMKGFEDLPDGSWFISAKIDNPQVWDAIKAGQLKGFSVEGIFSYVKRKFLSAKDEKDSHLGEIDFMSEVKDLWTAFKEKFLGNPPVAPQNPVQMQDLTLADGTTIQVDKLDVGGLCTVNGAPCPAGTYELADGTQVTVGDGGVISAVQMKATDPGSNYDKQFASYDEKFTSYEQKFADYEQEFQALATLQENFNKTNQMVIELMSIVSKIVETPTADPTEPKNNFQTQKAVTKDERRIELVNILAKIKEKK